MSIVSERLAALIFSVWLPAREAARGSGTGPTLRD